MDRQILNFTANEQILTCDNPIRISTNKVNYIEARFDLGQNWSGYDSVRAVWFNDFQCISTVLDSQGVTFVPFEVMKRRGNVKVNLVGSISEDDVLTDRLTSYPVVAVIVDCIAQITGANTSPITPSEYEQFVASVCNDADRAEQGASDAETYANNAETSADNALSYSQNAEGSAIRASGYSLDAQGYAQNAENSAQNAETYASEAEDARDEIRNMSANATTLPSGSDATASYSDGVLSLGIPKGDKGDTGDRGATGATPSFSIGTVETLEPTESATATITGTDENPVLNLGLPKGEQGEVSLDELLQNTIVQTNSDSVPYNFRPTPSCGSLEYDEIVGASVGWNQLVNTTDTSVTIQSGHKYYSNINNVKTIGLSNGTAISINDGTKDNITDLTLMLGSTIADYVYSLETATAGSGVAWLKSHFDCFNTYQPYDAGSIESVSGLQSHEMVGVNQFDETTATDGKFINGSGEEITASTHGHSDYIEVFPNTTYYMSGYAGTSYYSVLWLDADKQPIVNYSGASKTAPFTALSPIDAKYAILNYLIGQKDTVCFNISDTSINGQYFPYIKHTYPLDSALTLRGIPKLSDGKMYYDGDLYEADGTVTRRYGIVDLGSLSWSYSDAYGNHLFYTNSISGMKSSAGLVCQRYNYAGVISSSNEFHEIADKSIVKWSGASRIYLVDSAYSDATAFKTAMSGVYLVYELATPTTESADPYTNPQLSYDGGTEEYVSTSIVPIGHETEYPMTFSDTMPTADGTYTMSVTITNGKRTINWT